MRQIVTSSSLNPDFERFSSHCPEPPEFENDHFTANIISEQAEAGYAKRQAEHGLSEPAL